MSDINFDEIITHYKSKEDEKNIHLENIKKIVGINNTLEGNSFYYHGHGFNSFNDLLTKQLNIFWCGMQGVSRICEIGFNAGHSSMLLLLGREKAPIDFTVFDIGFHPYVRPTINYMQSSFPHVKFEYIEGDSTVEMPKFIDANPDLLEKYDVVHVDGGHSEYCISNDLRNADILLKVNGIMIIDDTNYPCINQYVDLSISVGKYVEVNLFETKGYPHRVLRKIE